VTRCYRLGFHQHPSLQPLQMAKQTPLCMIPPIPNARVIPCSPIVVEESRTGMNVFQSTGSVQCLELPWTAPKSTFELGMAFRPLGRIEGSQNADLPASFAEAPAEVYMYIVAACADAAFHPLGEFSQVEGAYEIEVPPSYEPDSVAHRAPLANCD